VDKERRRYSHSLSPSRLIPILVAMGGKSITVTGVPGLSGSPFAQSGQNSLTNHLLVAMPSLTDPNFSQTVALICDSPTSFRR
jgi:hypothetical protein